jgi:hypothetical protein
MIGAKTTADEAVIIGFERGSTFRLIGPMEFSTVLSAEITLPYQRSHLLPFLRAGFCAGYLNLTLPSVERIKSDVANRRFHRGRARKTNAA